MEYSNKLDVSAQLYHTDNLAFKFNQSLLAIVGALIAYTSKQLDYNIDFIDLLIKISALISWTIAFYFGVYTIKCSISTRNYEIQIAREKDNVKYKKMYSHYESMNVKDEIKAVFFRGFLIAGLVIYILSPVFNFIKIQVQ